MEGYKEKPQSYYFNKFYTGVSKLLRSTITFLTLITILSLSILYIFYSGKTIFFQLCVFLIAVSELFSYNSQFIETYYPHKWYGVNNEIMFLKKDNSLFRAFSTSYWSSLPMNTCNGMAFGIQNIEGYNTPVKRFIVLNKDIIHENLPTLIHFISYKSNLLNLMNVKYIISESEIKDNNLLLVHSKGRSRIYLNKKCMPRAFFVEKFKVCKNPDLIRKFIESPNFNPQKIVFLNKQPSLEHDLTPLKPPKKSVKITKYEPNKVEIQAENANSQILFLGDTFYPGWEAFINGKKTHIYIANYAFRAVYVPRGKNKIVFIYKPLYLKIGIPLLIIGILLSLTLLYF